MSIVSSSYSILATNLDGSRIVHESHVDSVGKAHELRFVAGASSDLDALLSDHAVMVAASLAVSEAQEILNG